MTPDDFESELERLGRRPRPEYGVNEAWVQVRKATVEVEELSSSSRQDVRGEHLRQGQRGVGRRLSAQTLRVGAWYIAASVVISGITMLAGWHLGTSRLGTRAAGRVSTYVTANAQRATITLPDGNSVALNVGSRLEVPVDYLAGNRILRLIGEAAFTIDHHAETPVMVIAGSATTRVLGTTFLVRHYATDSATTVAVREGRVMVQSGKTSPVVLTTARQLEISHAGTGQVQMANLAQFSFATGVLTIDGQPLREAIPELNRWYDADIRLGDPKLETRKIHGGFTAGSIAELQEKLEWAMGVRVVRTGRTLTLFPE